MISVYRDKFQKKPNENISLENLLEKIKNGEWEKEVYLVRAGKLEKNKMPICTISGSFSNDKTMTSLIEHSGYICIDVDNDKQIAEISKNTIKNDKYTHAIFDSVSGNGGFAIIVKIDKNKHLEAFYGLEKYYLQTYNIVIDPSCKNINRLRFCSFDPNLYFNEKSRIFKSYLKKIDVKNRNNKLIVVKNDFENCINEASSLNLFDDYHDYIKCAFALSSEFGENGRSYFHLLCQNSAKYDFDKCDNDYTKAVKRDKSGISIASLYWYFTKAGIQTKSEETKRIETIIKLSDNPIEQFKNENIDVEIDLVEKLKEKNDKPKTELDEVIELIHFEKIKFNEITRNYEFNGFEMNDRILSEFYTKVWQKIDDSISKDKVFTLIQNKHNTKAYNPIHDWFDRNANLKYENEFELLKECFEIDHTGFLQNQIFKADKHEYLDIFLKKWIISLVASAYGTYSLMILVLNGEQGTNKTKFFRNLLPKELRGFYAESNLDEGKDSEILMTKKWLIVDDEFGGKTKKDATKLKRLSSQQTFSIRMPYGRVSEDLNRLAVLGGTSNDHEVINDMTGNRRVIPINIVSFDFDKYDLIDKNKLFIWAYNEWKNDKEGWFLTKKEVEILNATSLQNTDVIAEEEIIQKEFECSTINQMTCTDVFNAITIKHPNIRTTTKRVGMVLKKLNFEQKIVKVNKSTKKVYFIEEINKNNEEGLNF